MASDWNDTRQVLRLGRHRRENMAASVAHAWPDPFCRRSIFSILIGGDRSRVPAWTDEPQGS